jgi:hypothetical protein
MSEKTLGFLEVESAKIISYVYCPKDWKKFIRPELSEERKSVLVGLFSENHPEMNLSDLFTNEFNIYYVYVTVFPECGRWVVFDLYVCGDDGYASEDIKAEVASKLPIVDGVWKGPIN